MILFVIECAGKLARVKSFSHGNCQLMGAAVDCGSKMPPPSGGTCVNFEGC